MGEPMQDPANHGGFPPINIESRRHHNQLRAALKCHERGHRGADAERPRLIIACSKNAAAIPRATHADRLTSERGPVTNLDRCVKTVHVEVDNDARRVLVWHEKNLVGANAIVHREKKSCVKERVKRFEETR